MSSAFGKCLCGRITVSITRATLDCNDKICLCHCKNYRCSGASLGSIAVLVPEPNVKITGQPNIYRDSDTDSGTTIQYAFCGNCSSPVYSTTSTMPGVHIVKLNLFDKIPKPLEEVYCKSRPV